MVGSKQEQAISKEAGAGRERSRARNIAACLLGMAIPLQGLLASPLSLTLNLHSSSSESQSSCQEEESFSNLGFKGSYQIPETPLKASLSYEPIVWEKAEAHLILAHLGYILPITQKTEGEIGLHTGRGSLHGVYSGNDSNLAYGGEMLLRYHMNQDHKGLFVEGGWRMTELNLESKRGMTTQDGTVVGSNRMELNDNAGVVVGVGWGW